MCSCTGRSPPRDSQGPLKNRDVGHRSPDYDARVSERREVADPRPSLAVLLREWGRIGCLGFGGPPTHISLLRDLTVRRRGWLSAHEFEDAIAATNLLPGPASTQLAIFTAWRLRGVAGALVGGLAFIVPGLTLILALAALFLGNPPLWVRGAGAGAGAAVAAVAVQAGSRLVPSSWERMREHSRTRWIAYALLGGAAAATVGPWLVILLIACGVVEVACQRLERGRQPGVAGAAILIAIGSAATGGIGARHGSRSRSARSRTAGGS